MGSVLRRKVTITAGLRAIGAVGIVVGTVINPQYIILAALGGFVLAGARLWWETGSVAARPQANVIA